jgi:hypothetical protein
MNDIGRAGYCKGISERRVALRGGRKADAIAVSGHFVRGGRACPAALVVVGVTGDRGRRERRGRGSRWRGMQRASARQTGVAPSGPFSTRVRIASGASPTWRFGPE